MGLLGLFFLLSPISLPEPLLLTVHFFDMGYGDAILIRLPDGGAVLIDSGKPEEGAGLLEKIRGLGVDHLDFIFITHFHKDHAGGLLPILQFFLPDESRTKDKINTRLIVPFIPEMVEPGVASVLDKIKRHNIEIAGRGKVFHFTSNSRIEVLHPNERIGNPNEDSLVLRLVYGDHSFLFAADVGLVAQKALISAYGQDLKSDLIKIPHHANEVPNEIFDDFINHVDPSVAVLTIGPNPYGAPNSQIMEMYNKKVNRIFRTDLHGRVIVRSDGRSLQVETERR
ncbi:MBL fold metallo-hydrolase [Nitrospira defluvii]|nr:MBL fold metallo-hydrolase [Nitrospira defluvii]